MQAPCCGREFKDNSMMSSCFICKDDTCLLCRHRTDGLDFICPQCCNVHVYVCRRCKFLTRKRCMECGAYLPKSISNRSSG